jgi:hypothetical protein
MIGLYPVDPVDPVRKINRQNTLLRHLSAGGGFDIRPARNALKRSAVNLTIWFGNQ